MARTPTVAAARVLIHQKFISTLLFISKLNLIISTPNSCITRPLFTQKSATKKTKNIKKVIQKPILFNTGNTGLPPFLRTIIGTEIERMPSIRGIIPKKIIRGVQDLS